MFPMDTAPGCHEEGDDRLSKARPSFPPQVPAGLESDESELSDVVDLLLALPV